MTDLNCKTNFSFALFPALLLLPVLSQAGEADVLETRASCSSQRVCSFSVTVQHADTGWDHYADKWEVTTLDGRVLGTRVLYHPHVNEQPFTRSLGNLAIPAGITEVRIRAHDSEHGYGGKETTVQLPLQ